MLEVGPSWLLLDRTKLSKEKDIESDDSVPTSSFRVGCRGAEEEDVVRVGPSCQELDELHSLSRAYDMLPGPSLLLHTLFDDAFRFCPRQQEAERTAAKTCINTRPKRPYHPTSRGEPSDHQSLCVLQQSAKPSSPPT